MSFFKQWLGGPKKRSNSAQTAKERIGFLLVTQNGSDISKADFIPQLQEELLAVISKYIEVNPEDIHITKDKEESLEYLEVKIEMDPQRIKKQ